MSGIFRMKKLAVYESAEDNTKKYGSVAASFANHPVHIIPFPRFLPARPPFKNVTSAFTRAKPVVSLFELLIWIFRRSQVRDLVSNGVFYIFSGSTRRLRNFAFEMFRKSMIQVFEISIVNKTRVRRYSKM